MRKAILILLLVTLAVSKSVDTYVMSATPKNAESQSTLKSSELSEAMKHIFGAVSSKLPSSESINFIKRIGKESANLFKPVQSGLMVLMHGSFNQESQQTLTGSNASYVPIEFASEDSFFGQVFGSDFFGNFGVSVSFKAGFVNIEERQTGKDYKGQPASTCVKAILGNEYQINDQTITDASSKVSFTLGDLSYFEELCSIQTIIDSFQTETPSFVLLELSSLKNLQQTLSGAELLLAERVVAHALNQVVSHFEKVSKNSTFAQTLFVDDGHPMFSRVQSESFAQKRVLVAYLATSDQAIAAQGYTLRAWFSIFFVALIFFVCYALFNVEIAKDSLLYAKFIADDRK